MAGADEPADRRNVLQAARRVARLPLRLTPYLAHPILTARMMASDDLQRSAYLSRSFLLSRRRKPWRVAIPAAAVLAALVVEVPRSRRPLVAGVAAQCLLVAGYRIRHGPRSLRRRGLPPGRVTIPLFNPLLDPTFTRRQLARHGQLFTTNFMYEPTVVIGSIARGREILQQYRSSLEIPTFSHTVGVVGGAVRNQSEARHRRTRGALARLLARRSVASVETTVESIVAQHVDRLAEERAAEVEGGLRTAMERLALDVHLAALLGVTAERDATTHRELVRLFESFDYVDPEKIDPSVSDEIVAIIDERRARPSVVEPESLLAIASDQPDLLDDPVVTSNLVHVMHTTRYDLAGLLTWIVYFLARDPNWVRRVRDRPDGEAASWIVSETLRLAQSEHVLRVTQCPVTIDRYRVPEGWWLKVAVREAHRDPAHFDRPDDFRPERFSGDEITGQEYAPFGIDGHSCVGEAFTRMFAGTVVRTLASTHELEILADGPPIFNRFHFWAPSDRLRIRLTPSREAVPSRPGDGSRHRMAPLPSS